MGVDFVLDLGCAVKEKVGTDGLIALVKSRSRARVILDMAREGGDKRRPDQIHATMSVITPHGTVEDRQISVQSLLDQSAPLDALAPHCKTCPANLRGPSFGCYGTINYPVAAATERWIMDLLPQDLNCTAGMLLRRAVVDLKYDGAPIEKLRADPIFYESRTPAKRTWQGKGLLGRLGAGGFSITSSQILQMMFAVGPLQPSHCAMIGLFLGLIPHDSPGEALTDRGAFKTAIKGLGQRVIAPAGDIAAGNFLHLFHAMASSVLMNVNVLIDA